MSDAEWRLSRAARDLGRDFDAAFARAHAAEAPPELDLLLIRVAEHGYALRLSQVVNLSADRKLVSVPSPHPELLGLTGARGAVVPVYDLRLLLGYTAAETPRWLLQVKAQAPLALAFEVFERHLRVPVSDLTTAQSGSGSHQFSPCSLKREGSPVPVLDLAAIFAEVTKRPDTAPSGRAEREERS